MILDTSVISSRGDVHQSCCYEMRETIEFDHDETLSSSNSCNTTPSFMVSLNIRVNIQNLKLHSLIFQKDIPTPGEGEYVDLNMTTPCCNLLEEQLTGDKAQFCDSILLTNRTLVLRARTNFEIAQTSWLEFTDIFRTTSNSSKCFNLSINSIFCPLVLLVIFNSKLYS